jgi:hypothetical protein
VKLKASMWPSDPSLCLCDDAAAHAAGNGADKDSGRLEPEGGTRKQPGARRSVGDASFSRG